MGGYSESEKKGYIVLGFWGIRGSSFSSREDDLAVSGKLKIGASLRAYASDVPYSYHVGPGHLGMWAY